MDNLRQTFYTKWKVDPLGRWEIDSWIKYKKIAYWLTALASMNRVSLYAFWKILSHIHYLSNRLVKNMIMLLFIDKIKKQYRKDLL